MLITHRAVLAAVLLTCVNVAACDGGGAASASAQSQQEGAANFEGQVGYELETIAQEIPDDDSPIGYWEVDKTFPVITPTSDVPAAEVINLEVRRLVAQYSCEGKGDETFNSENVFVGERVFSMQYEAMWMCATMPSPDSASGSLNFDLADGSRISLKEQFESADAYHAFGEKALAAMNEQLAAAGSNDECTPVTALGDFRIDEKHLYVSSPSGEHGESFCEVEVAFEKPEIQDLLKPDSVLR
jgi:hypothetical protein